MKLTTEETELFYKLNWSLLFYVNQKFEVIPGLKVPSFKKESVEKVFKLHEKVYQDPSLIDSFVAKNPFNFNSPELEIICSWKKAVKNKFLVMKHTDQGTLFFEQSDNPKVYSVFGLYDNLEKIIPQYCLPIMIETILLPFNGKIIYNGLFIPYNIQFGRSIRDSFEMSFRESKSKYGIVITLEELVVEKVNADEELMRTYARNRDSCFKYEREIKQLLKKNPSLWKVYYQSLGKAEVRKFSRRFSELGVNAAYFAILADIVVASGKTEKELHQMIEKVLPPEKYEFVYIFNYKRK